MVTAAPGSRFGVLAPESPQGSADDAAVDEDAAAAAAAAAAAGAHLKFHSSEQLPGSVPLQVGEKVAYLLCTSNLSLQSGSAAEDGRFGGRRVDAHCVTRTGAPSAEALALAAAALEVELAAPVRGGGPPASGGERGDARTAADYAAARSERRERSEKSERSESVNVYHTSVARGPDGTRGFYNRDGAAPTAEAKAAAEAEVEVAAAAAGGAPPPRHHKAALCTFFANGGKCRNGDACVYAHGVEELRVSEGEQLREPVARDLQRW